jgi:CDP-ribitol ribitolphosphotransferase
MGDIRLTSIKWERAICRLGFDGAARPVFLSCGGRVISLPESVPADGGGFYVSANMACADGRSFLPNGCWRVCSVAAEPETAGAATEPEPAGAATETETAGAATEPAAALPEPVPVSPELAASAEDYDRVLRYGGGAYAYTVTFVPFEIREGVLGMDIDSRFMKVNDKWRKRDIGYESQGRSRAGALAFSLASAFIRCVYAAASFFSGRPSVKKKRILFLGESNQAGYGNLTALKKRMESGGLSGDRRIREYTYGYSLNARGLAGLAGAAAAVAAADVIFVDNYCPLFTIIGPRRGARLIQLWHSVGGFKSVGYARFGRDGSPHPAVSPHRRYAMAVCGSEEYVSVFSEVFGIEESAVLPLGSPRMDDYLREDLRSAARERILAGHPELEGKEIILFAPTYRGNGQLDAYYDYSRMDFGRIAEYCGTGRVFVIKSHPFVTDGPDLSGYGARIEDLSGENLFDLMAAASLLITDYSSCYHEFSLYGRPILFFCPDIAEYGALRGFQTDPRTAPGRIVTDFDGLMQALESGECGFEKTEAYRRSQFEDDDRPAADRIIEAVFGADAGAATMTATASAPETGARA